MTYKITYNHTVLNMDKPITVLELVGKDKSIIGCYVNNRLRELTYLLHEDCTVVALTMKDRDARQIYNASLRYIVAMASKELSPHQPIRFLNGISRSLYMRFVSGEVMSKDFIIQLERKMRDIIAADISFTRKKITKKEAYDIFIKEGYIEKANIIKYRPEETCHMYECNNYYNYMYNRMVPSSGYIDKFNLIPYEQGVIIQYPRYDNNGEIPLFENAVNFHKTLQDAHIWAKTTGADTVLGINRIIEKDGDVDFINLSEAKHNLQLASLGNIIEKNKHIRLICIAGPSSSGKTTFANRLRIELLSRGVQPVRISLDDYYVDRDKIPLDENGDKDFETINSLDISLFNQHMKSLIAGEEVDVPIFSFHLGHKNGFRHIKLREDQPIIIEGIHALNEAMTIGIDKNKIYRIFIAPTAQIAIDAENPLSSTDLRLLRRMVRDNKYRSTTALETIKMWPSVRKGEFKWIYKTQENADFIFNSFLPYELCVMKNYALPLLEEIDINNIYFPVAERLIRMLKFFNPISEKWVPCNSLIREFIGGSCYQDV